MDFNLTEEQMMIRDLCRDFADRELAPLAAKFDEDKIFPAEALKKMGQLGLMGMLIPPEYGGSGADAVSYCLALMEINRACASTGVTMSVHNSVACEPIYKFGTEEQKRKYLPPLASGEWIGAFAMTEPNAGSDAASLKTIATLEGDHYILNGNKVFITSGSKAGAIIVTALTNKALGKKGISAFIVEPGFPGFRVGAIEKKLGICASDTAELIFDNCRVPRQNLLGQEGDGLKIALNALDGGRIGIASQAVGIATACLEASIKYAQERIQFGQPIAKFQAIQWMIADMATNIDAARLLTLKAAALKDNGQRFTKEASMAKLFATNIANQAAFNAIQIHGAYGYSKEYPLERYYRDVRASTIYEGTSEIQKMVIANWTLNQ